ncbi:MAG: DUF2304 domain-containing protein [Eubacterium sp.]|nr:DUF2304 domain-containing protein [Eubacterium sp.]
MTGVLRAVLVLACLLTCCYTLHKIRKAQMQIEDSMFWILMSGVLVCVSIFPGIAYAVSDLLGIGAPVNFVFLAMIFILLGKVFSMSVRMSQMEYRIRSLAQQIAIKNYELEKMYPVVSGDIGQVKDLMDSEALEQGVREWEKKV